MQLHREILTSSLLTLAAALIFSAHCLAADGGDANLLDELLANSPAAEIFPGSDEIQPIAGTPPAAPVLKDGKRIGFVFLNSTLANAVGYSGKPIHVLVGVDNDAVIRVARLLKHSEPIVLVGIPEAKITALIDGYVGLNVVTYLQDAASDQRFDAISGATVTVRVIDDSIVRSAIKIARAYGLGGMQATAAGPKATIDNSIDDVKDWTDLVAEQAVTRLKLSVSDVNEGFQHAGGSTPEQQKQTDEAEGKATFIDLYTAQVSVPSIGRSLLGDAEYRNLENELKPGQQAILLAARGRYSYKGSGYVRGGIFDRFEVMQGDDAIRFRDLHHKRLRQVAAEGAPADLKEVDLFVIPDDATLNPAQPWRLQLLVSRDKGRREKAFVTFNLTYQIPEQYLKFEQQAPPTKASTTEQQVTDAPPLWKQLWKEKTWEAAILIVALAVLTLIFFFQTWLVTRPVLLRRVRVGFLLFTLFGIGFYSSAQLSVVNILTVVNAAVSGFNWEYFLMEPLIFILWGSVATALLFWGRGAFCGWLCPFGALQELLNKLAKWVKIPQIMVPWAVHERLWPIKYIIFLVLFGVSLHSLSLAEKMAEVEPFKTVIVLQFIRDWPFVIFALVMLAAGLFIERFYCRYVCPLGAALAIPARMHMFTWLKRYQQCGNPCQVCAKECMVQAIHPEGEINPNECIHCLHCQELYHDEHKCPVMVKKRERGERRAATASENTNELGRELLIKLREEH